MYMNCQNTMGSLKQVNSFGKDFAMRMKAKNMNGNYCDVDKYF